MSSVEVSKLSQQDIAQLACTYAALILHDDGQDVTADKISALVKAAGVKVESYWPKMFAKALSGQSISSFFNFGGAVASGPAATSAPAAKEKEAAK
jgi:large subunit ribosomal protein LP1